jgi:hypothetical protein
MRKLKDKLIIDQILLLKKEEEKFKKKISKMVRKVRVIDMFII